MVPCLLKLLCSGATSPVLCWNCHGGSARIVPYRRPFANAMRSSPIVIRETLPGHRLIRVRAPQRTVIPLRSRAPPSGMTAAGPRALLCPQAQSGRTDPRAASADRQVSSIHRRATQKLPSPSARRSSRSSGPAPLASKVQNHTGLDTLQSARDDSGFDLPSAAWPPDLGLTSVGPERDITHGDLQPKSTMTNGADWECPSHGEYWRVSGPASVPFGWHF